MTAPTLSTPIPTNAARDPTGPNVSWVILVVGAILYGLACSPTIAHEGYLTDDPIWWAVAWLWVVPLVVYEIVDSRSLLAKCFWIAGYTFVTTFFFAGMFLALELRSSLFKSDLMGLIYPMMFGGVVLACVANAIVLPIELARWLSGLVFHPRRVFVWTGKLVAIAGVLIAAVVGSQVYRAHVLATERQAVIDLAEEDWRIGSVVHSDDFPRDSVEISNGKTIERLVDLETGLAVRSRGFWGGPDFLDYDGVYNERVQALIADHGLPSWSLKQYVVPDDGHVAMFESSELIEITDFPYEVGDKVHIIPDRTQLTIHSRPEGKFRDTSAWYYEFRFADTAGSIFVGRSPKYPEVTFVRRGDGWLGAYHTSGVLLSVAYDKNEPRADWLNKK